jgi:adenylate kinase
MQIEVVRGRDMVPGQEDRYGSFRQLIPDEQFLPSLQRKLGTINHNVVFDNIPRTEPQATLMLSWARENLYRLWLVKLNLTLEQVVDRTEGRMVCPKCGETYHPLLKPEKDSGKCDADGLSLTKRQGDMSKAVIEYGYNTYSTLIQALLRVMGEEAKLIELDASGTVEQTYLKLLERLKTT